MSCYTSSYCSSCISKSFCGWDSGTSTCRPGTSSGPSSGGLIGSWYYTSCYSSSSTYSYSYSTGFHFWSSWLMWLCVVAFVMFWVCLCACCGYRRRRATVVVAGNTGIVQPMNAAYAAQPSYPAQPGQPGYPGQAAPGYPPQQAGYNPTPVATDPACQPAPAPAPTGGIYA